MSLSTQDPRFIQHWVSQRGGRPVLDDQGIWPTIDFGDSSKAATLEWPRFFELMQRHKLSFVYDPAPGARGFSLVRDTAGAEEGEEDFRVVKNREDDETSPVSEPPDDLFP